MAGERINNPANKSGCGEVGIALRLGRRGREFKSHHSDHTRATRREKNVERQVIQLCEVATNSIAMDGGRQMLVCCNALVGGIDIKTAAMVSLY